MNGLLDSDSDSLSSCQHRVKARLHHILQQDAPFGPEDYDQVTLYSSVPQLHCNPIPKILNNSTYYMPLF